jgi:hypothetical protein
MSVFSITIDVDNLAFSIITNLVIGIGANLIYSIRIIKNFFNKLMTIYEKAEFIKTMLVILFIIVFLINENFFTFFSTKNYGTNLVLIFLFCWIIYFLMREKQINLDLSKKYEQLFNYLNNFEKELSKKSMIIHEFKNQIITIKGFNDGKNNRLDEYLESIIKERKALSFKSISKASACGLTSIFPPTI